MRVWIITKTTYAGEDGSDFKEVYSVYSSREVAETTCKALNSDRGASLYAASYEVESESFEVKE